MKPLTLAFLAPLLAVAACGISSPAGPSTSSGPDSGTNPDGGVTTDGSTPAADPDDESGPAWDGNLPGTPTLLASHVSSYALTRDDEIVFATTDVGVSVMPAAGGGSTSLGTNPDVTISNAGRAAIVQNNADGTLSAWTKAAGLRAITGITLGADDKLSGVDTVSGDFALVPSSSGASWFFDATSGAMTAIGSLPASTSLVCRATGETIACIQASEDEKSIVVFTVDTQGAHVLAPESGVITTAPFLVGGDVIYSDGSSAYRIAAGATTPAMLLPGATEIAALQDDWLAATAADGVHVLKADGSQAKLVASGNGAHIEAFTANTQNDHDSARIRWVGICDADPSDQLSNAANLRLYDPATDRTVPLSAVGCDLKTITYSDDFAFFIDGAHYVNDPVIQEAGDPTVLDLRDGSSRGNPTGMRYFDHAAIPIGQSRLLFTWLAFSIYTYGAYYDGHGPASTPAAQIESPIEEFAGFHLLAGNKGAILPTLGNGSDGDLYEMPLP